MRPRSQGERARRRIVPVRCREPQATRRAKLLPGSRMSSRSAERIGARFVAIGERRSERALEQIGISGIGSEGLPVVDFRRQSVSIRAGDQRRKIIAGLGVADLQFPRSGVGLGNRGRGGACRRPTGPRPRKGLPAASKPSIGSACLTLSHVCQSANKASNSGAGRRSAPFKEPHANPSAQTLACSRKRRFCAATQRSG